MRRKLPSLNAIRAFEASGRHLNFRVASEELGVTQGAVAQQVRSLERQLGRVLFERQPRGLKFTAQGALYFSDLTRAFDQLAEATHRLLDKPSAVTISVTPTVATRLLIPSLATLNQSLPEVELRTVATEALSDFDRDQVDLAIRLTRLPVPQSLEYHLLFKQHLIAVASPALVQNRPLPVTPEEFIQWPLLHDSLNQWPDFLQLDRTLTGPIFNQTSLALDAALSGQGVALACEAFVRQDLAAGRLIQLSTRQSQPEASYYLIRKRQNSHDAAAKAVWQWCLQQFSDESFKPSEKFTL